MKPLFRFLLGAVISLSVLSLVVLITGALVFFLGPEAAFLSWIALCVAAAGGYIAMNIW